MTLQDISSGSDYRELPQIGAGDMALLWHVDFWDGPITGLLEWHGERCWFQRQEEYDPPDDDENAPWPWYRRFLVIRLTPDQLREEERWHDLFRRCVGTHTDYHRADQSETGTVHPKERWAEFYDAYRERVPLDVTTNEVVGWFER